MSNILNPNFRLSTLEERSLFYKKEFSVKKLIPWFNIKPQLFAIYFGSDKSQLKFPSKLNELIILKPSTNLKNLKQKLLHYLPEGAFYDRNIYKDPKKSWKSFNFKFNSKNVIAQELAFDLDPENIPCKCKSHYPMFCNTCIKKLQPLTFKFVKELKKDFKKIHVLYSGRGFHIHIFDKDAYTLSIKDREELNKKYKDYPIDPWVSKGNIRLIRLPYSLNAIVSRIVIPINKNFNPLKNRKSLPTFLS